MQEIWAIELTILIDDPARATIKHLTTEIYAALNLHDSTQENVTAIQRSEWISPTPISIKMRLFCLPYAGGVSENIFAKFVPYISLNTITSMRGDVWILYRHTCNVAEMNMKMKSWACLCPPYHLMETCDSESLPLEWRWSMMLPASIQVCPVEIPGRGRREGEESVSNVAALAEILALSLPLQVLIQ